MFSRSFLAKTLILGSVLAAVALWITRETPDPDIKAETLSMSRRTLLALPIPDKATRIHTNIRGCTLCWSASAQALYATDLSPQAVCEYYLAHFRAKKWDLGKAEPCSPSQAFGRFADVNNPSKSTYVLVRAQDSASASYVTYIPFGKDQTPLIKSAKAAGKTVFVALVHYGDSNVTERECPDMRNNTDDCGGYEWSINEN